MIDEEYWKDRARQNQELLKNNPKEYVRRLRKKAEEFSGQFRAQLLEKADKIERKINSY